MTQQNTRYIANTPRPNDNAQPQYFNNQGGGGRNFRGQGGGGYHHPPQQLDPIPSPYNFVPLSDKVYEPDWATQVSADVPFSDGISGTLDIKVVAQTPIYVRNGGNWPERTQDRNSTPDFQSFFKLPSGEFALPGTALKGVIRAVVEIASFGKMRRLADNRYGFRDLYNPEYTRQITHQTAAGFQTVAKAGWLKQDGTKWKITPCDFGRVEQSILHPDFGTIRCDAIEKYKRWSHKSLSINCAIDVLKPHRHSCGDLIYREVTSISGGNIKGTLVFTGQPMARDGKPKKKHMEFVFFNEQEDSKIEVPASVRKDFVFIHSDDRGNPNPEWKHWKAKLEVEVGVPVFYLEDSPGVIKSMGLAMMYRLPYKHSIHEVLRHTSVKHLDEQPDLADLLFGHCHKPENALRGRVQFGLMRTSQTQQLPVVNTVLGGPKPTFYPNYLKQQINDPATGRIKGDTFTTYNDDRSELRGWKRYYTRSKDSEPRSPAPPTPDVATKFIPLPAGTVFTGKIRVHNLRPAELGALVWALTWGGNEKLRHMIGMAKPLGYGTVKVEISPDSLSHMFGHSISSDELNQTFESLMSASITGWETSDTIRVLRTLAAPRNAADEDLTYPVLTTQPQRNDFAQYKKDKWALRLPTPPARRMDDSTSAPKTGSKETTVAAKNQTPPADPWHTLFMSLKRNLNERSKDVARLMAACPAGSKDQMTQLRSLLTKRTDWQFAASDSIRKELNRLSDG